MKITFKWKHYLSRIPSPKSASYCIVPHRIIFGFREPLIFARALPDFSLFSKPTWPLKRNKVSFEKYEKYFSINTFTDVLRLYMKS
jgi:hypothetical protein